jgi:hypothetical protein
MSRIYLFEKWYGVRPVVTAEFRARLAESLRNSAQT